MSARYSFAYGAFQEEIIDAACKINYNFIIN